MNKKHECLADLRMQILTLDIPPGTALDEARLCDRYGMSRTPLREVLQRLSGEGFLHLEENRGAKVASLDLGTLRVFYQTAPMVYGHIARLAAENRTEEQLDALKGVQARFRAATAEGASGDAALMNHRFHELIGEMAHNPYLLSSLTRLLIDHTRLSQTFYRPESPDETALVSRAVDQHDAMIAALAARDAEAVVALSMQHWDLSRDRMERYVRPDPLPLNPTPKEEARDAV